MNNSLIIERNRKYEEYNDLYFITKKLSSFLWNYKDLFVQEKSISAISRIKKYLDDKQKALSSLHQELINLERQIKATCSHEILCEYNEHARCVLCNETFNPKDITFDHVFLKGQIQNYESVEIYKIIMQIANSNENPIESFEGYTTKKPELEKIKVFRRTE